MRKFTRRGVSPVIATILMVVITVILSATVVVMVMSYNSSGGGTRYGSFTNVEKDSSGQYHFYFGSFQPMTLFSQVKVNIAGQLTPLPLSNYTIASPYTSSSITYMYHVDLGGEGSINIGDSMVINFDTSMTGMVAEERVVFIGDGSVIAWTSIIVSGGGGQTGMDISGATAYGSPMPGKSWPLVLNAADQQYLKLAYNTSFRPINSLTIGVKFMLDLPPAAQTGWSSLINRNGDNDYRLQLSGPSSNNRWIEFGVGNNAAWVRSNGMRAFSDVNNGISSNFNVVLKAGVWYTAIATYDRTVAIPKMQLYVNDSAGVMQLAGEMPYNNPFNSNTSALYIGAGLNTPTRYFDGTIQYITIKVT